MMPGKIKFFIPIQNKKFLMTQLCSQKNDEILQRGGGYFYDKHEKKFLISSKSLLTITWKKDFRLAEEKMSAVEASVADVEKHDRDMSDTPGYVNKLLTVRTDIISNLCQNNVTTSQNFRYDLVFNS